MTVRKNCADALRQLMYFRTSHYYWIHALCIAQNSIEEKNHPVAMMGSIFQKAEHVLMCIGQYDDDGEYAMQVISDRLDYHSDHNGLVVKAGTTVQRAIMDELSCPTGVDVHRFVLSLAALTRRPYFTRVWVVQELFLARPASICCGHRKLPLAALLIELNAAFVLLIQIRATRGFINSCKPAPSKRLSSLYIPAELVAASRSIDGLFNQQCVDVLGIRKKTRSHRSKLSLTIVINLFSSFECEDPRDTLYGALVLIDWGDLPPIEPDYNISTFELATKILAGYTNFYMPPNLRQNLQVNSELSDVSRRIALRRRGLLEIKSYLEPVLWPSKINKIRCELAGRVLTGRDED